jgi:hypothetical protein
MAMRKTRLPWVLAGLLSLGIAWYTHFGTEFLRSPETRFFGLWQIDLDATLDAWARRTGTKREEVQRLTTTISGSFAHFRYRFTEDGHLYFGHNLDPHIIANYRILSSGDDHVALHLDYLGLKSGQTEQARIEYVGGRTSLVRGTHRVVLVRD